MSNLLHFVIILFVTLSCSVLNPTNIAQAAVALNTVYEQRALHNLDGIGKYYMGREIAKVMGYTGAGWLERPSQEQKKRPSKIRFFRTCYVKLLDLLQNKFYVMVGVWNFETAKLNSACE